MNASGRNSRTVCCWPFWENLSVFLKAICNFIYWTEVCLFKDSVVPRSLFQGSMMLCYSSVCPASWRLTIWLVHLFSLWSIRMALVSEWFRLLTATQQRRFVFWFPCRANMSFLNPLGKEGALWEECLRLRKSGTNIEVIYIYNLHLLLTFSGDL